MPYVILFAAILTISLSSSNAKPTTGRVTKREINLESRDPDSYIVIKLNIKNRSVCYISLSGTTHVTPIPIECSIYDDLK